LLTPFRRPHEGPTARFHGGQNLRRLGHPDPLEATQIDLWLACQPLDAAHRIEHVVRYVDRTRGPKAMDQNDSQQLIVTQTCRPETVELFMGSVVRSE